MKRTVKTKKLIAFAVVLIVLISITVNTAYAQDPFTAIAVGGLTGASGAGLFGSMAGMSGINIGWSQSGSDPMDAMWNVLNPDHVYFSGEKHEATGQGADIYDYIQVDIGDWLDAQREFIKNFETTNNVSDNDSGTIEQPLIYGNLTIPGTGSPRYAYLGEFAIVPDSTTTYFVNGITIKLYCTWVGYLRTYATFINGVECPFFNEVYIDNVSYHNPIPLYLVWTNANQVSLATWNYSTNQYVGLTTATSDTPGKIVNGDVDWTSGTVNTDVFNGWESAKVKIPHNISQLQTGWTLPDFLNELDRIWTGAGEDNIIIENGSDDPPVPPQPIPDTPLGDVPFDDWVDLWGQSIWDNLTRIEEKAELMVINQGDGLESIDDIQGLGEDILEGTNDLVGLATDIDENLEDMITYEQGISEDVEGIGENVEDIVDEVIVIVDEMGNVIDVLEGIDAKIYAQGQTIGSISTEVGTVADAAEAIQTEVEAQTETQEDIKEAVEDLVPYVVPLPDIATDTETMVDILPDIATATQTSTQTLTDTLPDIKDATQTLTDTLPDVITEIQDATTTLTDTIPNIDDICLNIDEAPYKDIETGVDRLPRFMLPFITDLRSALGIWHYVTEWIAQISTTFAFISGCLVGTSIMTPIYAAIAGFMCIKVYRRMTS